jgi:MFS family permease
MQSTAVPIGRRQSTGTAVLVLLVIAVGINYIDRGALSVSATMISSDLGLRPKQMGLLLSAFFWSYASFQLVAGWLVDRFPIKWVYAGGFFFWSVATAAVGLVYSFPALLIARLVLGIGESVAYPASSKVIVRYFPEERRGLPNSLVDAGSKLGPAISTLVGGMVVNTYGWRAMFLVLGIGSLLWLLPWLWFTESGDTETPGSGKSFAPGWRDMFARRQVWGTSVGMFALGYMSYFLLSWLPSYLVTERGLTMKAMAVAGSVPFLGMAATSLFGGWSSDRWIRRGGGASRVRKLYTVGGLVLCGTAILPAPWVATTAMSVLLITLACCFLGLFTSNVWAVTQTFAGPLAAGKWTGFQNAIGNLGGVAAPMLTGWIVEETGSFALAFVLAALTLFVGAFVYSVMLGEVKPLTWRGELPQHG